MEQQEQKSGGLQQPGHAGAGQGRAGVLCKVRSEHRQSLAQRDRAWPRGGAIASSAEVYLPGPHRGPRAFPEHLCRSLFFQAVASLEVHKKPF